MKKTSFTNKFHILSQSVMLPRLSHMVIGMAALMLIVRITAIAENLNKDSGAKTPNQKSNAPQPPKNAAQDTPKSDGGKAAKEAKPEEKPATTEPAAPAAPATESDDHKKKDTKKTDDEFKIDPLNIDEHQIKLLLNLADRRKSLAREEEEFQKKKTLIALSEKRLAEQMSKLEAIKKYIDQNKPVGMASPEENIKKMIKVYEGMPPDAAAKIFDKMNFETLIPVLQGMNQKKLAGMLAAMDPHRAREITSRMITLLPQ